MKKTTTLLLALLMVFTLFACNNNSKSPQEPNAQPTYSNIATPNLNISANTLDELEELVSTDAENTVATLEKEFEDLEKISTYAEYSSNISKIEAFYNKIIETTESLCLRLNEYALEYGKIIMSSKKSSDDKYDDLDEIYDCIYDDAGDEIYDGIYAGILDDMYDAFYAGVLDDAYDTISYSEWADARSDEYDWWSNARSDVYDSWSDTRSDIYDFWSDMRGALWDDDIEDANKILEDFKKDIEKIKAE